MADKKNVSVLNKKLVVEPLNRCRPIILNSKKMSLIKGQNLRQNTVNMTNLQLTQTLYKEDVMYESKPGDFLLGDSQGKVIIVNKLNLATSGSRTIAYFVDRKTSDKVCIQKTSDNVVALIGQKNYDLLFSALCSVINQELKIRGILALLTLQKKIEDGSCQTTQTIKEETEPGKLIITETKPVYAEKCCQTDVNCVDFLFKSKQKKRLNRRTQLTPYVVKDPAPLLKVQKKLILYPDNYADMRFIEDLNEGVKCEFEEVTLDIKNAEHKDILQNAEDTRILPHIKLEESFDETSNGSIGKISDISGYSNIANNTKMLLKAIGQCTEIDKTSNIPANTHMIPTSTQMLPTSTQIIPTSTQMIPASTQMTPNSTQTIPSSTQMIPTNMQKMQISTQMIPTSMQHVTTITQYTPTSMQHIPTSVQHIPTSMQHIPTSTQMIPASTQMTPNSTQTIPSSTQMIPTNMQKMQNSTQMIPTSMQHTLTSMQHIPTSTQHIPTSTLHIPTSIQHIQTSTQHIPTSMQHIPTSMQHIPTSTQHTTTSTQIVSEIQNNLNPTCITMLDGTEITVPVKPEDHFHIATPEILNNVKSEERKMLLWYQAYIDWKYCLQRDEDDNLPIHLAVLNNDVDLLRRQCLVMRNRKESLDIPAGNLTSLQMSIFQNTPVCTSMLLQYGADPMLTDEEHRNALHLAAEGASDQLKVVVTHCRSNARQILQEHEDLLWRPTFATSSNEELAKYLINYMCKMVDSQGYTPLMLASKIGNYENVKILIAASPCSVNVGMPNSGNTALYLAVGAACLDAADRSNKSKAAVHFNKTIETLVEGGADPDIENHSGSNVSVLLQEFNIGELSMLIANKLSNKHIGQKCDAFVLIKDENGLINLEDVKKDKPKNKRKNKDVGVVKNEPKSKPVILENIALPKIVAPMTPSKLKTARHFKTMNARDKLVAKQTVTPQPLLKGGAVLDKNEFMTTNKNVVASKTATDNSITSQKVLATNKYKPLKQLIFVRNKTLTPLEEVTLPDHIRFDKNDSIDIKDPLFVHNEVKKETDNDKTPIFDTVAVKEVKHVLKRKSDFDSAGPSSKKK